MLFVSPCKIEVWLAKKVTRTSCTLEDNDAAVAPSTELFISLSLKGSLATTTAEVLLGNQALVANVCNRVEFPRTQHSTAQNTKHRGKRQKTKKTLVSVIPTHKTRQTG